MSAAAEGIRDRLIKDNITLDIRSPSDIGSFPADERRVRQVLFNLLANAVGFSPPGATITMSAERRPDAVVFAVTDNGPGIPPEVQNRVFDWFESHSQARATAAPPRAVDRALLRRAARRHRDAGFRRWPGHQGRMQLPARAARRAGTERGLNFEWNRSLRSVILRCERSEPRRMHGHDRGSAWDGH